MRLRKCCCPPRIFALVPQFKLQNAFVHYGDTELKTMYGPTFGTSWAEKSLFNFNHIPQYKSGAWKFHSIRTNGFAIQVKLVALQSKSPYSPNVDGLREKGYDFPSPKRPVNVHTAEKGVYRITQERYDNAKADDISDLELLVIDPGERKMIAARVTQGDDCGNAVSIRNNSSKWEVKRKDWGHKSGSYVPFVRDLYRRKKKNHRYSDAVESLKQGRRRSSNLESITMYGRQLAKCLMTLHNELFHRQRMKSAIHKSQKDTIIIG